MTSLYAAAVAVLLAASSASAAPIAIVAAENFYGDVAAQIGGPAVTVTSILSNPDQDPHLFEASPSVARTVAAARIAVYSGIDYDPWMQSLLGASRSGSRGTIVVAPLTGNKTGDNPHVWYDPATMLAYAAALEKMLVAIDPKDADGFRTRLAQFQRSMEPVRAKVAQLHDRLAGSNATATEPIFGYMLEALGMHDRNGRFQLAVMNNAEPSASDVAAFENDLRTHQVRMLVYNSQASDPVANRMQALAKEAGVPVVGATETEPPGTTYQAWMMAELDAVDRAVSP